MAAAPTEVCPPEIRSVGHIQRRDGADDRDWGGHTQAVAHACRARCDNGGDPRPLTIPASDAGTVDALRFAAELGEARVWAVEDCRHVSGRLERGLVASGGRVVRVAPGLTESSRRAARQPGKSDPIDATAIARAALREGIDTLPVAFLDEQAHEIRLLSDYRRQLVAERVRLINRLRWHLVQIAPEIEAQIRPAGLIGPRIRARVTRQLARLPHNPQLRVARAILKRICENYREENELLAELTALIQAHCPQLLEERGCGTVTAAIIIGHTAGAKRFPTDACFARHAGTAPIPASSGNTQRHRLHRGGDRQLNHALHIIALSRARTATPLPAPTSTADTPKARPRKKRSAASNATSPATSGGCSTAPSPRRHLPRRYQRYRRDHLPEDQSTQSRAPPRSPCRALAETRKYQHSLDIGGAETELSRKAPPQFQPLIAKCARIER